MDTQITNYTLAVASLLFLTVLIAMIMIALFRQFRFKMKEYRTQLAREIELIDTERGRMYNDLHDELGNGLASIGILLQQHPTPHHSIQRKIYRQVQKLRSKIREIAYDFIPATLDNHGLNAAMIELFEEIASSHVLKIQYKIVLNDQQFSPSKAIHIYRITKEILINSLKHAHGSMIHCNIRQDPKKLILELSDDGMGFIWKDQQVMRRGAGLSHIQSRVNILNATLDIQTAPGQGTHYTIHIPLISLMK